MQDIKTFLDGLPDEGATITGSCHDCHKEIIIEIDFIDGQACIDGGSVYVQDDGKDMFVKCDECFGKDKVLRNYQPTQVYSRVVGYLSPLSNWNKGKVSEFNKRATYDKSIKG